MTAKFGHFQTNLFSISKNISKIYQLFILLQNDWTILDNNII